MSITLNSGTGGATVAADTITAVEHQLVKIEFGAAGSATQVSAAAPFPTDPQDRPLRDNGKIDVSKIDALPSADYDTGAGVQNVPMIGIGLPASGGTVPGGTATAPLQVSLANTTANATAVKVDGSAVTQPVSGTFWQATQPVSAASLPLPAGASTAAKQPALGTAGTASADVITVQGIAAMTALKVDGSAVTQPVSLTSTTITGTVAVTESGTWTVQPGNTANTTPWLVTPTPATSGGNSIFHLVSAATTNLTNVKASAGQLYGWSIANTNAAMRYVKLHNTAGAPTAGVGVVYTIAVPPGGASNIALSVGLAFSTGIAISTVTGAADGDTAAVAANDLLINLHYK